MGLREELLEVLPEKPLAEHRTSSVIVAAIKTSMLTVNEMGLILEAISGRICSAGLGQWPEYPELEETAHDLAEICENYSEAQNRIDERKHEEVDSRARKAGW